MAKKINFSTALQTVNYQDAIKRAITDPNEIPKFMSSIISVVSTNPDLEECDYGTILSAALCGYALKLPPSPQIGRFYMVPFNDTKHGRKVATFILGYKGYIQLAKNSGYYKQIVVVEVKKGEFIKWDPFTETFSGRYIEDPIKRDASETVGYFAYIEEHSGFVKRMYWPKEKMIAHAVKYSKAYAKDKKKGTSFSFWSTNFDDMAKKTMLRQIISKWGSMSTDMQRAYIADSSVVDLNGEPEYYPENTVVDAEGSTVETNDESLPLPPEDDFYADTPFSDNAPLSLNDV